MRDGSLLLTVLLAFLGQRRGGPSGVVVIPGGGGGAAPRPAPAPAPAPAPTHAAPAPAADPGKLFAALGALGAAAAKAAPPFNPHVDVPPSPPSTDDPHAVSVPGASTGPIPPGYVVFPEQMRPAIIKAWVEVVWPQLHDWEWVFHPTLHNWIVRREPMRGGGVMFASMSLPVTYGLLATSGGR